MLFLISNLVSLCLLSTIVIWKLLLSFSFLELLLSLLLRQRSIWREFGQFEEACFALVTLYFRFRPCDGFVYGVLCSKTYRYTIIEDVRFLNCLQRVGYGILFKVEVLWILGECYFFVQGGVTLFNDRFQVKVEIC